MFVVESFVSYKVMYLVLQVSYQGKECAQYVFAWTCDLILCGIKPENQLTATSLGIAQIRLSLGNLATTSSQCCHGLIIAFSSYTPLVLLVNNNSRQFEAFSPVNSSMIME